MIASLSGKVTSFLDDGVVIDVHGVGYLVNLPVMTFDKLKIGESVFFHIYHVIRQDSMALYGFESLEEREFFNHLIGVDGIGPKLSLTILSHMRPDAIRRAVFSEQPDLFVRVPGVGKRTAQKIQIYLQDKVTHADDYIAAAGITDVDTEVMAALTGLGYSIVEAQSAIQSISKDSPTDDIELRLRLALQYFSR